MDTERVNEAIRRIGGKPQGVRQSDDWNDVRRNADVFDYLTMCVTEEGFSASGVGVCGEERLYAENADGVAPGGRIRKNGYITIAASIGGNAVLLSSNDGCVYWADHVSFSVDEGNTICFEDRRTGEWVYIPWSEENIRQALVLLSPSIEEFLVELVNDKYMDRLDALD